MRTLIYNIVTALDDLIYRYELWRMGDDLDMFGVIDDEE